MAHDACNAILYAGFIVEAAAFHDRWRQAKATATRRGRNRRSAVRSSVRCGAYDGIFRAVAEACAGRFDGDDIVSPRVEARQKVTGREIHRRYPS